MNKNILLAVLFAAFASACTVNMGTPSNTTATANTSQPSSSGGSPANTAKPGASPAAETKPETSKKSSGVDEFGREKIQFPKGATDTTIERTIAPNETRTLLFNAKKGQTLWFKVTENTNQLEVDFNKNSVQLGEEVRESLNASGDWAIYVNNPTDTPLTYKLWIGIE